MKLLSLHITDPEGFRSLRNNFKIEFYNKDSKDSPYGFDPYCFVGRNGSGKSNVLEALGNIFYHIECIYLENKPDDFEEDINGKKGFSPEVCSPNAFVLEYLIPVSWNLINEEKTWDDLNETTWDDLSFAHIRITKEDNGLPEIEIVNNEFFKDIEKGADRTTVKTILPELIVGYSSGENETLSLPFFKMRFLQYDEYSTLLAKKQPYGEPEGRMIYLDNQYTQAILLSNFLLQGSEYLDPFKNEDIGIGIEEIVQFRLIIRQHHKVRFSEEILETIKTVEEIHEDDFDMVELTSNIEKSILNKLKACSTTNYYDRDSKSLILDYYITNKVDDPVKKAFKFHFNESPLELFRAFQTLLTLNLYQVQSETKGEVYNSDSLFVGETIPVVASDQRIFRIKDLWIKKSGLKNEMLSKSLSDGEHQFLHSIGICMLLRNTKSLFLLDEPETHFNPEWRAKFVSTLKTCLGESETVTRDILITTHSPFIISDCYKDKVKWFKKGESQLAEIEITTFGSSPNEITDYFFEYSDMIPKRPLKIIEDIEREIEEGKTDFDEYLRLLKGLGESSEKFMVLNYIAQLKEQINNADE